MHDLERAIGEIAGRQENLITRDQVLSLGVGRGAIEHRVAIGRWQRLHRCIYLIGSAPPTLLALARAAALALGDGAVVSHRTAAVVWVCCHRPTKTSLTSLFRLGTSVGGTGFASIECDGSPRRR